MEGVVGHHYDERGRVRVWFSVGHQLYAAFWPVACPLFAAVDAQPPCSWPARADAATSWAHTIGSAQRASLDGCAPLWLDKAAPELSARGACVAAPRPRRAPCRFAGHADGGGAVVASRPPQAAGLRFARPLRHASGGLGDRPGWRQRRSAACVAAGGMPACLALP